jgi:RNA-directed DNA polymerase
MDPIVNFDFQHFFGTTGEHVDTIINNMEEHVHRIAIPKRDGTKRIVLAPSKVLKRVQKSLHFKFFKKYRNHDSAHGFVLKRGIVSNAIGHVGAKSMGIIDIKNFFDSINENHLKNVLFGNKNICKFCKQYARMACGECNPSIYHNNSTTFKYMCEEMLALFNEDYCKETGCESLFKRIIGVCTYGGYTAQGFPTSPVIANIVLRGLDQVLEGKLSPLGIKYTRYADDLCVSSKTMDKSQLRSACQQLIYKTLWSFNFSPNKKKTTWKNSSSRLKVCGVVVNIKTSVQRRVVKKFRAKVHHITVKRKDTVTKSEYFSARGWASFLMSVDRVKGAKYFNQLAEFGKSKGWS